jgi:ElaB/YqjD/DUF883 family membrane-anchored ribosome-binding protein
MEERTRSGGLPGEGSAEVHGRVTMGDTESVADRLSAAEEQGPEGARERAAEAANRLRQQAEEVADRTRAGAERLRDRAEAVVDRTRETAERAADASGSAIAFIRRQPLVAAGGAFLVGYLIGGRGGKSRNPVTRVLKSQLRSVLVGAITAAAAQQARLYLGLDEDGDERGPRY